MNKPRSLVPVALALAALLVVACAGAALAQDVCAPAKVTTLHVGATGYYSYTVGWTATGDDCSTGNATSYELYRSTSNITDTNWQLSPCTLAESGTSEANGAEHCYAVSTTCPGTTYYYAVFLIDEAGNRSPISNVVTGSPRCHTPNTEVECY